MYDVVWPTPNEFLSGNDDEITYIIITHIPHNHNIKYMNVIKISLIPLDPSFLSAFAAIEVCVEASLIGDGQSFCMF